MKILCINIDGANEWEQAQAEFSRVGLTVERFPAIVEDNRVLAFNKSVMGCMKLAQCIKDGYPITVSGYRDMWESLLLFEDDVKFDIPGDRNIKYAINHAPSDYMTLHLGGNILGFDNTEWKMPTYYNEHYAKLHNCYQSHATLYSAECVEFITKNFPFVTDEYKTEGCEIFDDWLRRRVLTMGRSYVMKPMIAFQRPRWSSIWNVQSDYTYCHREGNKWLKQNL